jgi:L-fuculose-phosphate aldolase
MIDVIMCKEISRFGRKAVLSGLTSSRFGNISALRGNKIVITKSGSMLDELDRTQVVEVDLSGPCPQDATLIEPEQVEPIDSEGHHFLGSLPVVDAEFGTSDLAAKVSVALQSHNACIARGHGVFAQGQSLAEAYTTASMAEHSSQVRYLVKVYAMGSKG